MSRTTVRWPEEVLREIAVSDDLHVSPFREDGKTNGTPTWIWSVADFRTSPASGLRVTRLGHSRCAEMAG